MQYYNFSTGYGKNSLLVLFQTFFFSAFFHCLSNETFMNPERTLNYITPRHA